MSSMQVDNRERGFAYAYDAPLDMRMDPDQELTAAEIVNTWDRRRIARALREYGEERFADRIAGEIVRRRARQELDDDLRAQRGDRRRDPRARPLRRRPPGQAHLPGDPDRRQRRARSSSTRRSRSAWERREGRRPRRRAHLPLARGPPRQALLRREGPRLHLPARPARVRVRKHARGGARAPSLDRAHPGRDRGEPPIEVGSPPGRPQAQGGALDMPEHAAVRHPHRTDPPAPRLRPVAPPGAGRRRSRAAAPAPSSASPGSPITGSSTASCAVARCIWLIGILLGGIVAMQVSLLRLNSGHQSRAVQTQSTLEQQNMALQSVDRRADLRRARHDRRGRRADDRPARRADALPRRARPTTDPARAARRYKPPSERAKAVMANHGMLPGRRSRRAGSRGRARSRHPRWRTRHGAPRRDADDVASDPAAPATPASPRPPHRHADPGRDRRATRPR